MEFRNLDLKNRKIWNRDTWQTLSVWRNGTVDPKLLIVWSEDVEVESVDARAPFRHLSISYNGNLCSKQFSNFQRSCPSLLARVLTALLASTLEGLCETDLDIFFRGLHRINRGFDLLDVAVGELVDPRVIILEVRRVPSRGTLHRGERGHVALRLGRRASLSHR